MEGAKHRGLSIATQCHHICPRPVPSFPTSKGADVAIKLLSAELLQGFSGIWGGGGGTVGESDNDQRTVPADVQGDSLDAELALMSQLDHPNVLRVYGGCLLPRRVAGQTDVDCNIESPSCSGGGGRRLLVMELCDGNLASLLYRRASPLPLRDVLRVRDEFQNEE